MIYNKLNYIFTKISIQVYILKNAFRFIKIFY